MVVVLGDEGIEKVLQLGQGSGLDGSGAEPLLQGLLESLDFAAGGGAVGSGVLLDHVEPSELVLEGVASAAASGEADGVDHPIVSEGGGGDPMQGHGFAECCGDDGAGDGAVCGHVQGIAGAVVEPADDLRVGAGAEPVMGEVGLPGLVRHRGFEPEVGGPRSLLRFGEDQPGPNQVAADRRSGHPVPVVVSEVTDVCPFE